MDKYADLKSKIDERKIAALDAEDELTEYIKKRPLSMYKNRFDNDYVISSINDIRILNPDITEYKKLLKWKTLDNEVKILVKNLRPLPTNKSNNSINKIIREGEEHGFNTESIINKLNSSSRSSSWSLFGRGRKTHRKPSGSRGGFFFKSSKSLDQIMAEKNIAKKAVSNAISKFNSTNNSNPKLKTELSNAIQKAQFKLQAIEDAQYNAEDAQKTEVTPSKSSWWPFGGARKTHHKKRHMRKGSRKIHRK